MYLDDLACAHCEAQRPVWFRLVEHAPVVQLAFIVCVIGKRMLILFDKSASEGHLEGAKMTLGLRASAVGLVKTLDVPRAHMLSRLPAGQAPHALTALNERSRPGLWPRPNFQVLILQAAWCCDHLRLSHVWFDGFQGNDSPGTRWPGRGSCKGGVQSVTLPTNKTTLTRAAKRGTSCAQLDNRRK